MHVIYVLHYGAKQSGILLLFVTMLNVCELRFSLKREFGKKKINPYSDNSSVDFYDWKL